MVTTLKRVYNSRNVRSRHHDEGDRAATLRIFCVGGRMTRQTSVEISGDLKMPTIPVELPDELQRFVESKVQHGQFASANDYIVALVDAARTKRSELEAALIEGLQSGAAEEWTSQEWADIKRRVVRRHQES